jgi:putative membrane protein
MLPVMTLMVLCVDRDNDFGTKAGIQSPVIGREANLKAAMALSLADPEDSDSNSLYGAIKVFDELIAKGREAEVVTVCGSQRVGPHSDTLIAEQLDELMAKLKVDRAIFVTDGAEDEFILPLVTSRVKVEAVQRIIVRQHHDIEGTYYIIKKAFEDDKLRRSLLMPFSLALIVYGVFAFYDRSAQGLGAIAALVGLYFITKMLHLGQTVRDVMAELWSAMVSGKFTVVTSVLGGLLVLSGGISAVQSVETTSNVLAYTTSFASLMLWWLVGAALVHLAGRALDQYLREPASVWELWTLPFSLLALGLLGSAALAAVGRAIGGEQFTFTAGEFVSLALGVVIAFAGAGSNAFIKSRLGRRRPAETGLASTPEQPAAKAP